ncbi:hypothetical protein OG900_33160 [Streptomyces sp. NBC_00433]
MTAPADQGLAAVALAELTRQHLASAQQAARAADDAHRQVEQVRGQR